MPTLSVIIFYRHKAVSHNNIDNKGTKYETFVKKNYLNHSHSANAAKEGDNVPREFVITHDHQLEEDTKKVGTISEVIVSEQSICIILQEVNQ